MPDTITRCWLDTCRDVGHVVLYATADRLAGLPTFPSKTVVFCLRHGDQVYDVIRQWKGVSTGVNTKGLLRRSAVCPNWLIGDLRNNRLPRVTQFAAGWPTASPVALNRQRKGR